MSLTLAEMKSGTNFGRVEEGTHMARIIQVVDFGVQPQTDWKTGEATKSQPKVMITWEFPTSRMEIEKDGVTTEYPRWLGKEYTASNSEMASLMKLIKAIKPDLVSLDELLNMPCMVQVGTTSGGNAKVSGVMPAPGGVEVPALEAESSMFDFGDPTEDAFKSIKPWQQKKIIEAENYTGFADSWLPQEDF